MTRYLIILFAVLIGACKTTPPPVEDPNGFIGTPTSATCKIKAKIVSVMADNEDDTTTACGKHPCFARVEIIEVVDCGTAATLPYKPGDIVTMQFLPTLQPTKNILPSMRPRYPGLRRGDFFLSMAENRKAEGRNNTYLISHYLRLL